MSANITKKQAMKMMKDYFGKQTGKIKRTKMRKSSYENRREISLFRPDIEHTYLWMGMPNKTNDESIVAESSVIDTILGSGMDSRLFSEVREKRGLVYSISSNSILWEDGNLNLFSCSIRKKNKDLVLEIIEKEIESMQKDGFTEEEIIRAKNKIKSSFYRVTESSSGLVHNGFEALIGNNLSLEKFMNKVDRLTNQDLIFASNIMYDTDKALIQVCENSDEN